MRRMVDDPLPVTTHEGGRAKPTGSTVLPFPPAALTGVSTAESGLAALYANWYERLLTYASHYVPTDEAEDAVQRAFIELWNRSAGQETLDADVATAGKLFRTVRFRIMDYRNARRSRRAALGVYLGDWAVRIKGWMNPDDRLERSELATAIADAVKTMPPRVREMYAMHHEAGMSMQQLIDASGVGRAGVKALINRCNRILRDHLERAGFSPAARRSRQGEII